ncbi:MAG: redoxin domain-containing protein [Deltaproteobacteria bacterium]|nr:redoxin domain-containing protein [Deltaproteobacteria bacterium]
MTSPFPSLLPLLSLSLLLPLLPSCDSSPSSSPDADATAEVQPDSSADADPEVTPDVVEEAEVEEEAEADAPPLLCSDHNGISADTEIAGSGATLIEYRGYIGTESPYQVLRVQIMGDNVGAVEPGVYDLAGTTFETCEVCVSVLAGCAVGPCAQFFYPLSGTVEITAVGDEGDHFAAHLSDLELAEFEILPDGIATEPLPGGEDWCIADYEFDLVAASTHDAICARPTVPCLGETLLDFSLESCATGELVPMSSLAAGNKALVFSMVTGWCPYCAAWMARMVGYQATYADQGLAAAYVYGENISGGPRPTLDDCLAYADRHGAAHEDFYLDHDGSYSFSTTTYAMWPWLVTSDTMGLPWATIIDAETWEYVYTNQADPDNSEFESTFLGLLAP